MRFRKLIILGKAALFGAVLIGAVASSQAGLFSSDVRPGDLRCEYLKNPLGMDLDTPRLYWKVEGKSKKARGLKQSAYQIQVASTKALLLKNDPDLWDTGKVESPLSTHIDYEGAPLSYPMDCFWRVRIADQGGKWSRWSDAAFWAMGPMKLDDWEASWLGSGELFEPKDDIFEPCMSNPWIRKTYELNNLPSQALFHVASAGYHELYVNGEKVGDEVLSPHVSDLKKNHVRYKTYDIAPYLQKGKNAVVFWLGVGWAGFPEFNIPERPRTPIVMAQADLTFGEGEMTRWLTDASWKTHSSPSYLLGKWIWHQFGGDLYDANQELPGWNTPELDDSSWKAATVYEPQNIRVSAEKLEGNILMEPAFHAISVERLDDGVVKIDMGKNFSGWTQIPLKAAPGTKIKMTWSERPDLRVYFGMCSAYVMGPSGEGTFTHHFNYNSGRWIYIDGVDELPEPEEVIGNVVTTGYERVGYFDCDHPLFNMIYDTALWTFDSLALGGYVVDCPQRERLGYGGDGNATINMSVGNYDLGAFYNKWADDWRDNQREDGYLYHTAPTYIGGGGPTWSGFIICMPWEIYLQYGDERILSECYPHMKRWLGFLEANSKDNLIVPWGEFWDKLGDWLPPGTTGGGTQEENQCLNDCYWVYILNLTATIGDILGHPEDAKAYRARAEEVRQAVNAKWFDPSKGTYISGRQAYQAMALLAGVPNAEQEAAVWKHLEKDILTRGHIDAGITGGAFLFRTLMYAGRNDLIYPMVAATDYPGWGDMLLNRGATTLIENWDESEGHSRLHSSYLYVGNWFIEGLGGIKSLKYPGGNGFQGFVIEPGYLPGRELSRVDSSYNSLQGEIVSNWKVEDGVMTTTVTVPPNCSALMKFPVPISQVREKGKTLCKVKGVVILHKGLLGADCMQEFSDKSAVLESGTYTFKVNLE
ncbi:MAG: family 78 glycoside hydrolase catalytic domain [Limisphaerales bacterium]|jgi:alpha-L-rhamnosidase|nr:family 78 glycoside hydrolase catalytic domain [Verrucomicrobiota bacterium]